MKRRIKKVDNLDFLKVKIITFIIIFSYCIMFGSFHFFFFFSLPAHTETEFENVVSGGLRNMVSGWRNPTPFNTFPTMYDQIPELQSGTLIIRFM